MSAQKKKEGPLGAEDHKQQSLQLLEPTAAFFHTEEKAFNCYKRQIIKVAPNFQ